MDLLWLCIAGAGGTVSRYLLSGFVQRISGAGFPWGTFAVNIIGAFLFGLVWSLSEERLLISGHTRLIVLGGFMGAFTTFSTFMFETGQLLRDAQWGLAAGNLMLQIVTGIIVLFLGLALGRLV
ncbi:MAG: fluoride efflux transporter FluC [Thermodesulfobacteriota bacterium]